MTQILGRRNKSIVPFRPHRGENDWFQQEAWGRVHRTAAFELGCEEESSRSIWIQWKGHHHNGVNNLSSILLLPAQAPNLDAAPAQRGLWGRAFAHMAVSLGGKEQQRVRGFNCGLSCSYPPVHGRAPDVKRFWLESQCVCSTSQVGRTLAEGWSSLILPAAKFC